MASLIAFASLLALCSAIDPRVTMLNPKTKPLMKREACTALQPQGGSTAGQSYGDGSPGGCPVVNRMDASGSCKGSLQVQVESSGYDCTGYCEVRNYFTYNQEIVFTEFSQCGANEPCTFTSTDTLTVTQTFEFNIGAGLAKRSDDDGIIKRDDDAAESVLKPSFNLGASYSYSTASSVAKGLALTRPTTSMANCGYWTFVPIFWTSCGTMTTSEQSYSWSGYGPGTATCEASTAVDTANYCNTMPYLDSSGKQAGESVFVLVDCTTNLLLPASSQNPIYAYPGVANTNLPS